MLIILLEFLTLFGRRNHYLADQAEQERIQYFPWDLYINNNLPNEKCFLRSAIFKQASDYNYTNGRQLDKPHSAHDILSGRQGMDKGISDVVAGY